MADLSGSPMSKRIPTFFFSSYYHLQLLNSWTHLTPTQATANSQHFNHFPARHVTASRVEGWTGGEIASWAGSTTGNQETGKESRVEEEEEMVRTHPLEVLSGHPSNLDSTLQHIVQQLDILTQVSYQ